MFIFIACGIWLIGLGLCFVLLRPRCSLKTYVTWEPVRGDSICPTWTGTLDAPRFHCDGWLHNGCGSTNDLSGDECICRERWPWIVLALAGLFTSRDDEPDELSAQLRFQMAALIPSLLWFIGLVFLRLKR